MYEVITDRARKQQAKIKVIGSSSTSVVIQFRYVP